MTETTAQFESQHERWLKYGANVALSIIVVIALAVLITCLAQRVGRRIDTTTTGLYSLKPQTVNLIKENKQKIRLVSLYAAKDARQQKPSIYAGPVNDLLEEYARKGSNIEFESIDPITQPAKVDALVKDVIEKYGGAVKVYDEFIRDFFKTSYLQLKDNLGAEAAAVADIRTESLGNDERGQILGAVVDTIREQQPQTLTRIKDRADRALRPKFPDYKVIVDRIKETGEDSLDRISQNEAAIIKIANQYKEDQQVPPELKKYLTESIPRHEQIKKLADEAMKKIDSLGELKIGDLQQAIKGQDLIVVLGENDWRVINFEQVWVTDTRDIRAFAEGKQIKPRFAGEQAVTTAILSLTQNTKPKVVFVRAGGAPLTTPGFPPFQRGGPLSEVADRLRSYNFEVLDKDASGTWAMQAQMQNMPPSPEPSDKDIENAVWVVVDTPQDQRMPIPQGGGLAAKLAEHLKRGGAAMVIALPQADNLASALNDYGVEILPEAIIVHDVPKSDIPRTDVDLADEAQRLPFVFVTSKYGGHMLTQPVESLDALLVGIIPVKTNANPGVKATPLLPIPQFAAVWGERDIESISSGTNLRFDEGVDLPAPLFAGAVLEKDGGGRLVVIGAMQSFMNQVLTIPDAEILRSRGVYVTRFPGNSELFVNSIFWLAKMDSMIAITPKAMEVPRIAKMSDTTLATWRYGFLLIGLPAMVLVAGIAMYLARRS